MSSAFARLLLLDEARMRKGQLGNLKMGIIEQGDIGLLRDDIVEELFRLVVVGLDAGIFGGGLLRADIAQRAEGEGEKILAIEDGRAGGKLLQAAPQGGGPVFVVAELILRESFVVEG